MKNLFRMVHCQRLPQRGMQQREDRRVCPNPQCQCQNGRRREARVLSQHPQPIMHVLPEILYPTHSAHVPALFFNLLHAAYATMCRPPCFGLAHSRRQIFSDLVFEMKPQLLVELALQTPSAEYRPPSQARFIDEPHSMTIYNTAPVCR